MNPNLVVIDAGKIAQQHQQMFAEIKRRQNANKAKLAEQKVQTPNKPA